MVDQRSIVELLYKVSREFATALDLRTVLTRVLFAAINNVGGERASIVVMDDAGRAVESAIVYGNQVRESTTVQLRETIERGLAGWVVRNREAALVQDTSKDERWLRREDDAKERSGAKAAICVPLLAREKLVGVMTLVHAIPNSYTTEHFELMQAIADQAGVAVLNARLFTESQRQARVMTALAESAVSMNTSLQAAQAYERILSQTRQALQVESVALGMIDPQNGDVQFLAAVGPNAKFFNSQRIPQNRGIAGRVVSDGRGIIVPMVGPELALAEAEKVEGSTRALICGPIHAQGRVIGVLEAFNPTNRTFDPDALLVLTGLGSLAGTIIQNVQLYEKLDATHQRYRELFEDNIDPIIITDRAGQVTEANRRAEQLSGYSASELRQFNIRDLHELNREKTGEALEKIHPADITYESTLQSKDGSKCPVEVHTHIVFFDEQESIQWLLRDITERKELDALREDLAAMIYHDLRSPLANILSSVEMLGMMISEQEKDSAETVLRIAHHSIERIQRLISSLLDINRLEQNHALGEQQAMSVGQLFQDAVQASAPAAESRNQSIRISYDDNIPAVFVDADMIRRVLINLVENAIKYTPQEGTIELLANTDGEWISFIVQDNGPGIPAEDREKVFNKFTRLKKTSRSSGLGVGLAFCKLAVEAHRGKIWIESAPEQGSRFIFTLPVSK